MSASPSTDFRRLLEPLARRHDYRTVFNAFVRLSACALAAQTREPEYIEEAKRWSRDELDAFGHALGALVLEMEEAPFTDVLGTHYMEFALSKGSAQCNGEFHTPAEVCRLMARVTMGDHFPSEGPIAICEPCCGAGAMILATFEALPDHARPRARFTAIDISATACDMCFINTTLWGVPCRILHGNALSCEYWHAWSNVHLVMPWLRFSRNVPDREPARVSLPLQGAAPAPCEVAAVRASLGVQAEFSF